MAVIRNIEENIHPLNIIHEVTANVQCNRILLKLHYLKKLEYVTISIGNREIIGKTAVRTGDIR